MSTVKAGFIAFSIATCIGALTYYGSGCVQFLVRGKVCGDEAIGPLLILEFVTILFAVTYLVKMVAEAKKNKHFKNPFNRDDGKL
ncbi:hypothetical protein DOM22_07090 [Bdellovibrio sp. ZAP7]|uniref:hypothetical protein n=1 Tax=Bdellovibrio sp. ZAP7 TaxID=2231053 RepID=UPI001157E991|nr:hypothetical protein [Bdellovibrio sp. ZAP7]QDK44944.1 hypothetical protein DOM22_07090 [Bdellovibrio sp. ZAP7]